MSVESQPKTFGDHLRAIRLRSNISARRMASFAGDAREDDVLAWERGVRTPSRRQVKRLLERFGHLKTYMHLLDQAATNFDASVSDALKAVSAASAAFAPKLGDAFSPKMDSHLCPFEAEQVKAASDALAKTKVFDAVPVATCSKSESAKPPPPEPDQLIEAKVETVSAEAKPFVVPSGRMPFHLGLRLLRERSKLLQREVAELLGRSISGNAVGRWEAGLSTPVKSNYEALLSLFPDLNDCEVPDARDIPIPAGRGPVSDEILRMEVAEPLLSQTESKPIEELEMAKDDKASGKQEGIALVVRLTKASMLAKKSAAPDMLAFLRLAVEMGVTLPEALELIDSA